MKTAESCPSNRPAGRLSVVATCLATLLLFWPALEAALALAFRDERYFQIVLAPVMCAFLVFWLRRRILAQARYAPRTGFPLFSLAMLAGIGAVYRAGVTEAGGLTLAMFALVLAWMAVFLLSFGAPSFRAGLYPLCCLFLMVPLPSTWMDRVVTWLQHGSAACSYQLLRMAGIPVFRRGTVFSLASLDFEVGPECSGIRSGMALLMVAIVAGFVYLRSGWARAALILLTVPIVIVKNAVRIATLTTLGAYVDRIFIDGPIHHRYGGLVFAVVGVSLFVLVLAGLQEIENRLPGPAARPDTGEAPTARTFS